MRFKKIALLVAATGTFATPALADWPADDEITFVIPYGPGGGFDTIVRTFAPALEQALGATIVPENVAGASGSRGGQQVYRADPDGYTIGIFNVPGVTVTEATSRSLGYPLEEVTWIASVAEEVFAVAVQAESEIGSIEELCADAASDPVKLSDTGLDSTSSITSVIMFDILDCPIVNVTGYNGSNDTMIAVMRGEVDATVKPIASLSKYVESGDLKIVFTLTEDEVIDGVQAAGDIGHPELARFTVNRVIGGPPGMPEDIVNALSAAFETASQSGPVQEWASGTGTVLSFRDAAGTSEMMSELSDFYGQYTDLLTQ